MAGVQYSRRLTAVAQVAVMLLLVQAMFGAGACLAHVRAFSGGPDSGFFGAICSPFTAAQDDSGEGGSPAGGGMYECPFCAAFGSVIVGVGAALPAMSAGGPVLASVPAEQRAGVFSSGYRNRGPPLSLGI